jgi:PTH1 family peptidyl-tRNA hydrolase
VIYDEIDLAVGKVKLKVGGGDAGHNGIKSINAHANKNYAKLRVGVGHPGHRDLVHSHVLGDFTIDEMKVINSVASKIAEKFPDIIRKEYDKFASVINN